MSDQREAHCNSCNTYMMMEEVEFERQEGFTIDHDSYFRCSVCGTPEGMCGGCGGNCNRSGDCIR